MRNFKPFKRALYASAAIWALSPPVAGAAEPSGESAQSPSVPFEEITVTARKREESIQAVPIAITAFTQADLTDKGVNTIGDIAYLSPSVYIQSDVFQQDTLNITIRGQRNFAQNGVGNGVEFDTAAAVYINGIYLARTQGLEGSLFDVDTVEVLKGPQGTLVGRNSTGGAVLYTTKEPEDKFGGSLNFTAGDYGQKQAQAILNVPLSEKFAVRTAFSYGESDGYLKNLYSDPATGARNTTNGFGYRKLAGQFSVKWTPDDTFKLVLRGDFESEHDTGSGYHDVSYYVGTVLSLSRPSICNIPGTCTTSTAPAGTGFTDLLGHYVAPYYLTPPSGTTPGVINTNPAAYNTLLNSIAREQKDFWTEDQYPDPNIDHFHTISALADKTFGDIDVKWVAGYRWFDTSGISLSRGDPYDTTQTTYVVPNYKAYTSDLTVNGNTLDDKLKWTGGAFFFKESAAGGNAQYLYSPNYPMPAAISGHQVTLSDTTHNSGHNESYAVYTQETYSILPELRLTAGVRYNIDDRAANVISTTVRFPATPATAATVVNSVFNAGAYVLNGISYNGYSTSCAIMDANGVALPLSGCSFSVARQFKKPTWNVSLDYDLFDKTLVYVTTRKGYKSGGINVGQNGSNSDLLVALPETVQDYEIGIKSDWLLGGVPVRTNVDGYLSNYHDIQTAISLPFVAIATGPGGGPCTQIAFNAGQCSGTSTQPITVNAKAARLYGFEWDVDAKPISQLTVTWGGSYLHAYYTDFSFVVPAGYLQPAAGTANLSGQPFPLPQWQMNASATYGVNGDEIGLPVEQVSLTAQWYWQTDFLAAFAGYRFPDQKAYGYQFTNLRLNIKNVSNTGASLNAYVTNLFDKAACSPEYNGILNSVPNATNGSPNTSGVVQCVPLPPRMFGVRLSYAF